MEPDRDVDTLVEYRPGEKDPGVGVVPVGENFLDSEPAVVLLTVGDADR
jgi:hypothetical protein